MRYLLHESQRGELVGRQQYLYDVFRTYFLPGKPEGGFIPLEPVGTVSLDVLFITGHANYVGDYLKSRIKSIPERIIVITSCMGRTFRKHIANKAIYVPDIRKDLCYLRSGKPYGFDFNISDAELNFYNSSGSILERIQSAYDRLL